MLVCVKLVGHMLKCSWVTLCIQVLTGAIVYAALVLIYLKKSDSFLYAGLVKPFLKKRKPSK